jgi:hypothetical protein
MPNFNGLWTSRQQMQARGGNTWPAVPGAPTSPVATAGNASASVAFTAPADTGYPAGAITGYRATSTPGGFTGTGLTSPVTVTGLTNGTAYTFTVAAQNVNGYGPESVASSSVTPVLPNYVEEVFSTYLYTGTGAAQTITNGIDLSTKGGLVWLKNRDGAPANSNHNLVDTIRGISAPIYTNSTGAQLSQTTIASFNTTGFSMGAFGPNASPINYTSWTFREQPKFFDIVTWTGNGASNRLITHALGAIPAIIMIKATSTTGSWYVNIRSSGLNGDTSDFANVGLGLESTSGRDSSFLGTSQATAWTSTQFTLYSTGARTNVSSVTYVAYLFAHNAGGFGLTGTDNVISCGIYTGNGSSNGPTVTLGYEPQFLIVKRATGGAENWVMLDNMRGWTVSSDNPRLSPNLTAAETNSANAGIISTGFKLNGILANVNASGSDYIYIAIRRGPMKVPTLGTSVFQPVIYSGNGSNGRGIDTTITPDLIIDMRRDNIMPKYVLDRMRANGRMYSNLTNAESTNTAQFPANTFNVNQTGITVSADEVNTSGRTYVLETFRRAPGFFDEVCYTGTGAGTLVTHNLAAKPELVIYKSRSAVDDWPVNYTTNSSYYYYLFLNLTTARAPIGIDAGMTSTTITPFRDSSGVTYVAYLFATLAGVSKVGSYTGTGATQTIACGFAAGARFVLIKRTDTTGDWYVWDSVRGMVAGTDPSLLLNTAAAEVNANSIYAITTGFQIVSTAAGINASGGTYIFLAIA